MELQRARRWRDELGHEPLCDERRVGIFGETDPFVRRGDVPLRGPRVDAERARGLGERALEDVPQDERAQVRAAQRVPADEIAEPGPEEPSAGDRFPDLQPGRPVELADPQQRGDLGDRELSSVPKTRDEALDDDIVRDRSTRGAAPCRRDAGEGCGERPAEPVELGEANDLDHRGVAQEEPRHRMIALGDDDDRDRVLARKLHLDPDSERGNAGVGDDDGRAGDVRAIDLVHRAGVEMSRRHRVGHAMREVRTQVGRQRDLRQELVEDLRARAILERGERARDVRLAGGDRRLLQIVHGAPIMLGQSSSEHRIRAVPEQRVAENLRQLPLFSRLPEPELAELGERVRTKSFRRGETIFRKDDPGTHLYMVLDGAVKIALPGEFGQEALVAIMRPGEFFGELALFDRSPRSASATALEDTRAALLAGDDFLAYLEAHPASFRVVLETLARTIRRLSDRVEDLIFLDVPSRVAKYLLDLARSTGDGTELTLTQDELAAFIGASRVSVNRVLGDLERREIISIKRRHIAIKDADRLGKEIRF